VQRRRVTSLGITAVDGHKARDNVGHDAFHRRRRERAIRKATGAERMLGGGGINEAQVDIVVFGQQHNAFHLHD
jgi:hypothetical protein